MKIKDGMLVTQVGEEFVAVPTGTAAESFHGIIRLNETAADIYHGIEDGKTVQEITAELIEKYDGVDAEKAEKSINNVIEKLTEKGILEA